MESLRALVLKVSGEGSITFLPSGTCAEVAMIQNGDKSTVVKIIPKGITTTMGALEELQEHITAYNNQLRLLNVPVANALEFSFLARGESPVLVMQMPYLGPDFETQIKEGKLTAEDVTEKMLGSMSGLFTNEHMPIGIDPKPANFVGDGTYIDLTPPRIRRNGEHDSTSIPILEWPNTLADGIHLLSYWRWFTMKGTFTVLQDQVSRLAPKKRPDVKKVIREFLRQRGLVEVLTFLLEAPWERYQGLSGPARNNLIDSLQPDDMYIIREIALEAACAGLMSDEDLEQVFQLSHCQFDLIPSDKLIRAQRILRSCV